MAKSFGLDSSNDIILKNGYFQFVSDGAETVQHVRSRLLFYLEEWFLDRDAGTPWFQRIFIKPANLGETESIIKQRILQTDGVERLIDFSITILDPATRAVRIDFSAETTYGLIENETLNLRVDV